jgi:predicted nucleotidyltransferase
MATHKLSELEATAVRAYVDTLHARCGSRLLDVVLFGSRSRGDAGPDSDIDVLVILDDPSPDDLSEARGLAFDIWLTHDVLLSVRAMSQQGWHTLADRQSLFYRHVTQDGISLLAARV